MVYNWKEAATVILFAKHGAMVDPQISGKQKSEAATSTHRDYKILTLERTGKSKFMPSAFVFPGGWHQ